MLRTKVGIKSAAGDLCVDRKTSLASSLPNAITLVAAVQMTRMNCGYRTPCLCRVWSYSEVQFYIAGIQYRDRELNWNVGELVCRRDMQ